MITSEPNCSSIIEDHIEIFERYQKIIFKYFLQK